MAKYPKIIYVDNIDGDNDLIAKVKLSDVIQGEEEDYYDIATYQLVEVKRYRIKSNIEEVPIKKKKPKGR